MKYNLYKMYAIIFLTHINLIKKDVKSILIILFYIYNVQ